MFLAGRDQAGLAKAVAAVADPHSASYQHYLTPAQVKAALRAVRRLRRPHQGVPDRVRPDDRRDPGEQRLRHAPPGPLAQLQKAFGTTLHTYSVSGHTLRAASSAPTVPASLSADVVAVSGLASISQLMTTDHVGGPTATHRTAAAAKTVHDQGPAAGRVPQRHALLDVLRREAGDARCPTAYGKVQPYAPCGYVPDQLAGRLRPDPVGRQGLRRPRRHRRDHRRVRRADDPGRRQHLRDHARPAGVPRQASSSRCCRPSRYRYGYDDTVNGDLCGEQGWYGEETLDVEAVHAMAPGANVTYVAGRSCDNADLLAAVNKVVARHLADIVTNSWGGTDESNGSPALDTAYEQAFYQAALEGIGVYFSSGDSGDGASDNGGVPTVQSPANSPLVTAVGGTALAVEQDQHPHASRPAGARRSPR